MLTLTDTRHGTRRGFLQVGSLGVAGTLALPELLRARASSGSSVTGKSVILLFMHGGPSQLETFDPKMGAPAEIRSTTGEIATVSPGVTFGSTFEKLAALSDRFSIVRSFTTGDGNHDIKPVVSRFSAGANLGALYGRVAGTNNVETGMPTNAALFPRAVVPESQPANMNFGRFSSTGSLGSAYAPFVPGGGGDLQQDMELHLSRGRLADRRSLLAGLDRLRRDIDAGDNLGGVDRFREQAFETILGGVSDAFDLSREDPRTLARYDTAPLVRPDQIDRKWNNYNNYVDNARTLGRLLLLARRLVERGCGFVTVTTNFVWDMHADRNNAGVAEGMRYMGLPFDHAVSAFIEDVAARGLTDDVALICCGEMGRTPRINKNGGRDHWGRLAPLMVSGGGLRSGQVIGQSTRDAGEPLSEPQTIDNLIATILGVLFDIGELRVARGVPVDIIRLINGGVPITGLS